MEGKDPPKNPWRKPKPPEAPDGANQGRPVKEPQQKYFNSGLTPPTAHLRYFHSQIPHSPSSPVPAAAVAQGGRIQPQYQVDQPPQTISVGSQELLTYSPVYESRRIDKYKTGQNTQSHYEVRQFLTNAAVSKCTDYYNAKQNKESRNQIWQPSKHVPVLHKEPLPNTPLYGATGTCNYNTGQNEKMKRKLYQLLEPKFISNNDQKRETFFNRQDSLNSSVSVPSSKDKLNPPVPFRNKKRYEQRSAKPDSNLSVLSGTQTWVNTQPEVSQQMKHYSGCQPNIAVVSKEPQFHKQKNYNDFQPEDSILKATENKYGNNPVDNISRKSQRYQGYFNNCGGYRHGINEHEGIEPKDEMHVDQDRGWTILEEPIPSVQKKTLGKYKNRRVPRKRNNQMKCIKKEEEPSLLSFSRSKSQLNQENIFEIVEDDNSDSASVCGSEFSVKSSYTIAVSSDGECSEVKEIEPGVVHKNAKGVIGVFWDIKSCSVPKGRSCREIVKKIRDTFYGNRKEDTFIVACDIFGLPHTVRVELSNAQVELVHVDSGVTSTADSILRNYLCRFVDTPKPEGSCIVLISGDFDFAGELHNLHYRHQVYVVLIHSRIVKQELCDLASQHILFEDFVKNVSLVELQRSQIAFMLIENIPMNTAGKAYVILKHLVRKMDGIMTTKIHLGNCTAKFFSKGEAKLAYFELNEQKLNIFGSQDVKITLSGKQLAASSTSKTPLSTEKQIRQVAVKEIQEHSFDEETKQNVLPKVKVQLTPKPIVVLLLESSHIASDLFWKGFLRNIIKDVSATNVLVDNNLIQIHFDSLNSAKKIKKLIEKDQQTELNVIGIRKSVNLENIVSELKMENDLESLRTKCKFILEKKCRTVLNQHSEKITDVETEVSGLKELLRSRPSNSKPSECQITLHSLQVTQEKLLELQAQKEVFKKFIAKKMNLLDDSSAISIEKCNENIASLKRDIGRECHLFSKALPIYATKTEVIEIVEKYAVSIMLAETGSGKSTQITQFLYQTQLPEIGRIVCTQPRKLAARSLAEYVSQEMGCAFGTLVGAKVGMFSKISDATRILYMTDHSLLNECLKDPMLESFSCVIVDEVHERSIFTDLLLGMLKGILQKRPDFKIVLTSATINPKIFQEFFEVPDEAVLKVSGRVFPIEIIWSSKTVTVGYDYNNQAVLKAFDIHMSEEAGHILVFVTNPAETQKACETLENLIKQKRSAGKAVCLPLHGKLTPAEQQKVFIHVSNTIRKIIFATNCAETSITVPGICYVVDTGMAKELQYDSRTQTSVLKLSFVTQSSAEQRKGRAGRTQAGKCYRLFSKENYDEMLPDMKPEILRVNLGQAILKLMELGVDNPCNFQFVESPPPNSFLAAMHKLLSLGAIWDNKLTELGKKMAKLPLEPSLSKLVIRGIEENVGYEAVLTATLASVSGIIFFRVEENKLAADLKKTQFCQEDGDFYTFLEVYKEWSKAPKAQKGQWCVANFINGKSMKITNETVKELLNTCEQELRIPVSVAYSSQPNVNTILQYLLLEVFSVNLCIFSGHPQMGYISLKDFGQVHMHPSSSLHYLGHITPEFIIFQTNLVTTRDYIHNITPISGECMDKAIENGIYEPTVLQKLRECTISPLILGPYGSKVLKQFVGMRGMNRMEAEKEIIEQTKETFLRIEVDFPTGIITICCKKMCHVCAQTIVNTRIQKIISEIQKENQVVSIDGSLHGIGYLMSAGAVITDVIMPKEFITFSLNNLDDDFVISQLITVCEDSGHEYTFKEVMIKQKKVIFVTCKLVSEAKEVCNLVSEKIKCTVTQQAALRQGKANSDLPLFQLHVNWIRRQCNGIGFVKFETPDDFYMFSPRLISSNLESHGKSFKVQISKKNPHELFLRQLHESTKVADIQNAFKRIINSDVKYDVKLVYEKPFETTSDDLQAVELTLGSVFSQYTPQKDIIVQVFKPQANHTFWRAKIFFHNARDGQTTFNALKNYEKFPGTNYQFQMFVELNTTIVCHKEVFNLSKDYLDDTMEGYKKASTLGDYLTIKANPSKSLENFVSIDIKSNNLRDLELVRKNFQDILRGEKIDCLGNSLREKLFLESGKHYLRKLEKELGAKIHLDYIKKTISIMGTVKAQTLAKSGINSYLDLMYNQFSKTISLAYPKKPKGLLKCLFREFDYTMDRLQSLCELGAVELNLMKHTITFYGKNESIQKAEDVVNRLSNQLLGREAVDEQEAEFCPVCFSFVDEEDNPYRLQCCGHIYCQACIQMQLKDSSIPLACITQDCNYLFTMEDFRYLLTPEMKRSVASASLKQLVQRRGKEFKYCPTPECPVVYKVPLDIGNSHMTCSHCTNQICTRCNAHYHHGMTCEVFQSIKADEDYPVKLWMLENPNNRKKCPKCNSGIEKNGGCNHMTCWSCGAHICWLCMTLFPTAKQVYDHQPYCPNQDITRFMF